MEKPYILDVIDYYKDIDPYGFIQIYSGVGSGKSTFINNLISGYTAKNEDGTEYTVPPKTVLLITSRRAKVDEILNDTDISVGKHVLEWENGAPIDDIDAYLDSEKMLPDFNDFGRSKIHQRSIACTNAAIEKYLQKHYIPSKARTHLWQRFDYIVLDEAHSVVADASYQSAPYYVHRLVNEAHAAYRKGESTCKVIVMTGSPNILSNFNLPSQGHSLDLMDVCKNVVPEKLSFIDSVEAQKELLRRLESGERVIYFANHIKTIFALYGSLDPKWQEVTAFSFTQKERLDISDPAQRILSERMENTENTIAETQMLPDNIKLFLTTSKNKEGINIWNKNIKAMFVESHNEVDLIQMAGRARKGIEHLFVITDSGGFGKTERNWEYLFSSIAAPIDAIELSGDSITKIKELDLAEYINHHFYRLCNKHNVDLNEPFGRKPTYCYEEAAKFIDFIHNKFPYIRFDYFTDKFQLYKYRKKSIIYSEKQSEAFSAAGDDKEKLTALAQKWFKDIDVIWPQDIQSQIDQYITDNELLDVPYSPERRNDIIADIGKILGNTIGQFNHTLNAYGYKERRCSNNASANTYGWRKITKL